MKLAVVGAGRMGNALVHALRPDGRSIAETRSPDSTQVDVSGPFGRGFDGAGVDAVLLAVPDAQIAVAASAIADGPLVGHCAGSLGLDVLGDRESFAMHPLMTVTASGADFTGAGAAVAGSTPRALGVAHTLADALGMHAFTIADRDRALYHAAAAVASNFLVTLEDAAETLIEAVGGDREILVPIVRAAVENWAVLGGPAALTGPIARGDEATVARQRAAIAERAPEMLAMFDALADRTRALARRKRS